MINRRDFVASTLASATFVRLGEASPATTDVADMTLQQAAAALRSKTLSPVELTRACLARIEVQNPKLNAFITVTAERALARAHQLELELVRGQWRGPLHGIPLALKDNIDTAGVRTTAAAKAFADRVPATDAEVVRRLDEAGAIVLGKLNMDECAYGVTSDTGYFGAVQNPWRAGYTAGGSSGGPAAAVAARLCYGAIGTDTGGSIRQPAAYCGVVGLKPSYGLVSARGVIPLSWSLDHVGPLCRTAGDAAVLLQVIAGFDPEDPASIEAPPVDFVEALAQDTRRLRIGRPRQRYFEALDPEVESAVTAAIAVLRDLTAGIQDVELPDVPRLSLMFVEANAYFSKALEASPDGFSASVRGLINMGGRISAADYAGAKQRLEVSRRTVRQVFNDVDVIVTPTTPNLPDKLGAGSDAPAQRGPPLSARNTTPFNIYGLPTVSVNCGFSKSGLPIGLQISGPPQGDATVLALAHAYQRQTDWHTREPGQ